MLAMILFILELEPKSNMRKEGQSHQQQYKKLTLFGNDFKLNSVDNWQNDLDIIILFSFLSFWFRCSKSTVSNFITRSCFNLQSNWWLWRNVHNGEGKRLMFRTKSVFDFRGLYRLIFHILLFWSSFKIYKSHMISATWFCGFDCYRDWAKHKKEDQHKKKTNYTRHVWKFISLLNQLLAIKFIANLLSFVHSSKLKPNNPYQHMLNVILLFTLTKDTQVTNSMFSQFILTVSDLHVCCSLVSLIFIPRHFG